MGDSSVLQRADRREGFARHWGPPRGEGSVAATSPITCRDRPLLRPTPPVSPQTRGPKPWCEPFPPLPTKTSDRPFHDGILRGNLRRMFWPAGGRVGTCVVGPDETAEWARELRPHRPLATAAPHDGTRAPRAAHRGRPQTLRRQGFRG